LTIFPVPPNLPVPTILADRPLTGDPTLSSITESRSAEAGSLDLSDDSSDFGMTLKTPDADIRLTS
jgi:hypothetical protein